MKPQTVIVVLAAGRGSRFGGPRHKLVQELGDASVLGRTIGHAIETRLPVLVVTTEPLAAEAACWVARRDIVLLPEVGRGDGQPLGMGYSIATGVAARPNAAGWLVLPGDMPLVQPATLQAVAAALEHHPVAYAQHQGRRGHPVGFAAELFSELVALTGDEGARRVMARYPSLGVELPDPGVLVDVDTEADLAAVRAGAPGATVAKGRRASAG
ncbi:nucleotidyltransferase family protein [Aquabacterium sp. OR-4]|uniref:nucleotidyltransferase family protein n=1 Tax=Aquabacterium sp. OR-4 TaxID=2978127 RepID=UPI0021B22D3D|nr:nucleotidyltransferase family protein [Aquabacterium sp. OR-4]MDT7836341.1 nucleotidyltransferase family protein [Aquabacterium sp. OR-4]